MQVNSIGGINFTANVSKKFQDAVRRYYNHSDLTRAQNQDRMDNFMAKVDEYKLFGNKDMDVVYKISKENGKKMHALYIEELGYKPVLLAKKDQFRKLLGKFIKVNDYEFNIKVKQSRE